MRQITTITGKEIVEAINTLYNEGIKHESDINHFSLVYANWLGELQDAIYTHQDTEAAKKLLSLNKSNYLGKKTRALLHVIGAKEPKNLTELISLLSNAFEKEMSANDFDKDFPVQDDIWPSRRWNKEMTEYTDLSGE